MAPKVAASALIGALAVALACGGPSTGPSPSTPRIDYVDGAIEPLLVNGQTTVLEGFGFGDSQGAGTVQFAGAGGVPATIVPGTWSDRTVRVIVPDNAASGTLTLSTATGRSLSATVHVLPHVTFDPATLAWQGRATFDHAPVGVALAAGAEPLSGGLHVVLYAAGGAETETGTGRLLPDVAVFVTRAAPGGAIAAWTRGPDLPAPRAFASLAIADRFNSRYSGRAVYVIGGIDDAGRAQATVYRSLASNADTALGSFSPIEPLPAPVAGAIAVVRRGRIYVMGGADSLGRPQPNVFVGRIGIDGHIDGWYAQPPLPSPRAYGGGVVLDDRASVFGGISDSAQAGGGLDTLLPRLTAGDDAALSLLSGFFTGAWAPGGPALPAGRSQFATLPLGETVLLVGGVYAGASTNTAETIAAVINDDSLGDFSGPVGMNSIAGLGGGTLVSAAGTTWMDADGSRHGLVFGGIDLVTRERRAGAWGF